DVGTFAHVDTADAAQLISFLDSARTQPGLRMAKTVALDRLRLRPGQTVLEIGSGTGEDVLEMARRVIPDGRVIGVDISEAMLAEARRRATGRGLPVEYRLGDGSALPLPDDSVDRCRADTVLQHVADPDRTVAEMVRVVRPGGRVVALEFDLGT